MSKAVSIISLTRDRLRSKKKEKQTDSVGSEKRVSQWEEIMRKFSESHKEECKSVPLDMPRVPRQRKVFPSGSQYEGTWDVLGMSGKGIYIFPNGVVYEGEFDDGMFHGHGEMRYKDGTIVRGKWSKDVLIERTLVFEYGIEYEADDWMYCKAPDRRYAIEYEVGLQPAGLSFVTAEQPSREIPPGHYDTGDGFYNPERKTVLKPDELSVVIRAPKAQEQRWIKDNCRVSPDVPLGPQQDLYKSWSKPDPDPISMPQPGTSTKRTLASFTSRFSEMDSEINPRRHLNGNENPNQNQKQSFVRNKQHHTITFNTEDSYTEMCWDADSDSFWETLLGKKDNVEDSWPTKNRAGIADDNLSIYSTKSYVGINRLQLPWKRDT